MIVAGLVCFSALGFIVLVVVFITSIVFAIFINIVVVMVNAVVVIMMNNVLSSFIDQQDTSCEFTCH